MMGGFFALPFLTYLQIQPPIAALFLKYTSHGIGLSKRLIFRRSAPFLTLSHPSCLSSKQKLKPTIHTIMKKNTNRTSRPPGWLVELMET